MHFSEISNKKIIKHDLLNKFHYNNIKDLPELKQVTLNFGCKSFNAQKFATTLLALEILASKKGSITTAKKANLLLKIQKGQPAGCKVILKKKEMYTFINRILIEILPRIKNFTGFKVQTQTSTLSFQLPSNQIVLQEFENVYPLFSNLPHLDISILTTAKNRKELMFLTQSLKIPVYEGESLDEVQG
jgi:large subunit ribosomal protein L5